MKLVHVFNESTGNSMETCHYMCTEMEVKDLVRFLVNNTIMILVGIGREIMQNSHFFGTIWELGYAMNYYNVINKGQQEFVKAKV